MPKFTDNYNFSASDVRALASEITRLASKLRYILNNLDEDNLSTGINIVFNSIASALTPATDNNYDIGTLTRRWQDIYLAGVAYVGTLTGESGTANVKIKIPSGKKVVFYNSSDVPIFTISETGETNNVNPSE